MKKRIYCLLILMSLVTAAQGYTEEYEWEDDTRVTTALTAGYVFKHDCLFEEIYGHGIVNVITADGCYYVRKPWGIGAKISYWRASGRTTFLQKRTHLQEIPLTFYLRRLKEFRCGLKMYGSLGGGLIWIKEKSYQGSVHDTIGIGEAEFGLSYALWRRINFTSAFRYLFPRQCKYTKKNDVGGFDLRGGFEFQF